MGLLLPVLVVVVSSDLAITDLISLAKVKKALSTLLALLAEVSINLIPKDSANSFPSSKVTYL